MNILCTICSDLVNSAESACVTKCGHIFHHHCLAQWNERSKTCPQCRHSVTSECFFRIYPAISNDVSVDNAVKMKELEDKIGCLTSDFKNNEKILHETEEKLVTIESNMYVLNEKLKTLDGAICELESRRKEERDQLLQTQQLLSKERKDSVQWQFRFLVTYENLKDIEEKMKKMKLVQKEMDAMIQNQQKVQLQSKELDRTFCGVQNMDTTFIDASCDDENTLQNPMVNRIENTHSPYMELKVSNTGHPEETNQNRAC